MSDKPVEYAKQWGKLRHLRMETQDHGILILSFQLDFGGEVQGGHVVLDAWDKVKNRRVGTAKGADAILQFLQFFKVSTLEAAAGRTVCALYPAPMRNNDPICGLEIPPFDGGGRILFDDL